VKYFCHKSLVQLSTGTTDATKIQSLHDALLWCTRQVEQPY